MDDDGEPISRGQLDRRAADVQALRHVLHFVALIAGAALVNGILAILLIELFQAMGWWEASAVERAQSATEMCGRLRLRAGLAG